MAEAVATKIDRSAAKELFVGLGLLNAVKWDDKKLLAQCCTLQERLDDDEEMRGKFEELSNEQKTLFKQIVEGVAEGDEIELGGENGKKGKKNAEGAKPKAEKSKANGKPAANGARPKVFGEFSVSSITHYMGENNWSFEDAKKALDGLKVEYNESSVRTGLTDGKNPKYSKPAKLSNAQKKELKSFIA